MTTKSVSIRKIKRQRVDFHHKTARRVVNEFGVIVVEDLDRFTVARME
jgi:IS605 OrfB family transposase